MNRFVCTVCGHTYDPGKGEPRLDLAPGTAFEDLAAGWQCPVCFAGKDKFVKAG